MPIEALRGGSVVGRAVAFIGLAVLLSPLPQALSQTDPVCAPASDPICRTIASLERDSGMIETVFPSSHPAQVNRMLGVYEVFVQTPQSAYYGASDQNDAQMWQLLIQLMCSGIQQGRWPKDAPPGAGRSG